MNQHYYLRQGTGFDTMSEEQREAALALMKASLSADGLELSRDIMRLNHTLGELNGNDFEEYGEWLYWITVMGEPSATEPWGWQLDGHHLVINYFVVGDQVVMSPVFVGSEPVTAESGKYAGTTILADERSQGLALLQSLNDAQQQMAVVDTGKEDGLRVRGPGLLGALLLDVALRTPPGATPRKRPALMLRPQTLCRTATPGRTLPSSHSKSAPPAGEA
jgi:hypothetical protein